MKTLLETYKERVVELIGGKIKYIPLFNTYVTDEIYKLAKHNTASRLFRSYITDVNSSKLSRHTLSGLLRGSYTDIYADSLEMFKPPKDYSPKKHYLDLRKKRG